jgi:hypothetical protein
LIPPYRRAFCVSRPERLAHRAEAERRGNLGPGQAEGGGVCKLGDQASGGLVDESAVIFLLKSKLTRERFGRVTVQTAPGIAGA